MNYCEVTTKYGSLRGERRKGVSTFRGIPYAKPPVGELRFAPPQPPQPWNGVREAVERAPIAPQPASDLDIPMGPVTLPQSEDCLTLTVNTPDAGASLPVAVWFHGGANVCGGGDLKWYDGGLLARRGNLVTVNVNFRLGALGFMMYPGLNEKNLSILDQIAALRWVQENIGDFGGDPNRVTVFGQSAGANAIIHMMSLPETEGLFHRVILQSPSIGRANHTHADACLIGAEVLGLLGIDTAKSAGETAALARAKTPEEILEASAKAVERIGRAYGGMLFKPVMDRWNTPEATIEAAVTEAARRSLSIMIGTTRNEFQGFNPCRDAAGKYQNRRNQILRFDGPAMAFATRAANAGCDVWKFRFDWQAKDTPFEACHCIELPFVFGNLDAWGEKALMLEGADMGEMERMRDFIQPFWCRFIQNGDQDAAEWPRYSEQKPVHKIFDNKDNGLMEIIL